MTDATQRLNDSLEGRYRIERELGEGGMATVYLADDLKHERKVALKVLKPELAAVVGADRFLAEIKTTANLQHPHILPLHDSGEAAGFLYYVMPYVEGESLRERLNRESQLPVDEAVRIATDVAEALQAAHEKGVIHRDIKPANILLSGGRPLVADFGIALAISAAGGGRMTETGLSLGTPHYMSPEQATGDQTVGPTTDVYALGCVLYEMLVGEPPYTGGTAQAILGKIITEPPPAATQQRKSVPSNVEATILTALQKVPADRFRTAQDLKKALDDPSFGVDTGATSGMDVRALRLNFALAGALAAMTALALWGWSRQPEGEQPYQIVGLDLSDVPRPTEVALSPQGEQVVVVADGRLWIRSLDELSFREMPNTEGALSPAWSPNGEWIAFGVGEEIRKIHRSGQPGSTVMRMGEACSPGVCGPSWTDDGRIIAATGYSDILVVPEDGGTVTSLLEPEAEHFHFSLALPGGAVLLNPDKDVGGSGAWELWDGVARTPAPIRRRPYYAGGFLLYNDRGDIWALEYSASDRALSGDPVFVASGLRLLGASEGGTLLARPPADDTGRERELMWIDRAGDDLEPAIELPEGPGTIRGPSVSSDAQLAWVDGGRIWTFDPERRTRSPIPVAEGVQGWPTWSRDGRTLYFTERVPGASGWAATIKRLDLESRDVSVVTTPGQFMSESAGGRYLVYVQGDIGARSLHYIDLTDPDAEPQAFDHGFDDESAIRPSPVHDVAAFVSRNLPDARNTLWLDRLPSGGELVQVDVGVNSSWTAWSADGTRLYYLRDDMLMEIGLQVGPGGVTLASDPVELFSLPERAISPQDLSVSGDTARFLVGGRGAENSLQGLPSSLVLIQGWEPGG